MRLPRVTVLQSALRRIVHAGFVPRVRPPPRMAAAVTALAAADVQSSVLWRPLGLAAVAAVAATTPVFAQDDTAADADDEDRRRVVLVCDEWGSGKGGLSTANRSVAEAFALDTRTEVVVVLLESAKEDAEAWAKAATPATAARVTFVFVPSVKGDAARRDGYAIAAKLRECGRGRIDVVLGHARVTGMSAAVAAKELECAYWHMVHVLPNRLDVAKEQLSDEKREQELKIIRGGGDHAHASVVLGLGTMLERDWRDYLDRDTPLVRIDPWLPDREHGVADARAQRATKKGLLVLGRMEHFNQKGVLPLMAAFTRCGNDVHKDAGRPEFFVRGITDPAEADQLMKAYKEADLGAPDFRKNFFVPQRLTQNAALVAQNYELAELVVMPSEAEAFGLVALEAVAAGKPVLVSNDSGFGMMLEDTPALRRFAGQMVVPLVMSDKGTVAKWTEKLRQFMAWRKATQGKETVGEAHEAGLRAHPTTTESWMSWGAALRHVMSRLYTREHASQVLNAALRGEDLPEQEVLDGHDRAVLDMLPTLVVGVPEAATFVECDDKRLATVRAWCARPANEQGQLRVYGITGMSGTGKSALASAAVHDVLHSRDVADHYDVIIWADASTKVRLLESLARVVQEHGRELNIHHEGSLQEHGHEGSLENMAMAVQDWLQRTRWRWLLVLNNADGTVLDTSLTDWLAQAGLAAMEKELRDFGINTVDAARKLNKNGALAHLQTKAKLSDMDALTLKGEVERLHDYKGSRAIPEDVAKVLPRHCGVTGAGRIVITSCRNDIHDLHKEHIHVKSLSVPSPDDAVRMACQLTECAESEAVRKVAVDVLGRLPMAIKLVATYLSRNDDMTWDLWYARFGNDPQQGGDGGKMLTAWKAPMAKLRAGDPEGAHDKVLRLLAVLAPKPVPTDVITRMCGDGSDADGAQRVRQALDDLCLYSMVTRHNDTDTVEVHQLLQAAVRSGSLCEEGKEAAVKDFARVRERAAEGLVARWPRDADMQGKLSDLRRGMGLLDHGMQVVFDSPADASSCGMAKLAIQCGYTLTAAKDHAPKETIKVWERAVQLCARCNPGGEKWFAARSQLAHAKLLGGSREEAVKEHRAVVRDMEEASVRVGDEVRERIYLHLAMALRKKVPGDKEATRANREEALKWFSLAMESADMLVSTRAKYNCGMTLEKLGRASEGVPLIDEAVHSWEVAFSRRSPLVAEGRAVQAKMRAEAGRVDDALKMLGEALEVEKKRGETLNLLLTRTTHAQVLRKHVPGMKRAAREEMREVVEGFRKLHVVGDDADYANDLLEEWEKEDAKELE